MSTCPFWYLPTCDPQESPGLASWVRRMRYDKKLGQLPEERVKKLEDIGFKWALRASQIGDCLARLKVFKEKHGVHSIQATFVI